jgi:hypothetical protein
MSESSRRQGFKSAPGVTHALARPSAPGREAGRRRVMATTARRMDGLVEMRRRGQSPRATGIARWYRQWIAPRFIFMVSLIPFWEFRYLNIRTM